MSATKDARGVEIYPGATCVYGAGVGRSIALVEAVVDGFTDSGRVWVRVVRRSYGETTWSKPRDRVHVGPDRIVIVDALPDSPLSTQAENAAAREVERTALRVSREALEAARRAEGV
ncbi:hypothetical protein [Streptomyces sp. NPDC058272]|uniref:hypothetical protein n=1 Tax=Streptomyces sp. NPDC058272 TaxID=3346415 RepID=UPI0036EAD8EE